MKNARAKVSPLQTSFGFSSGKNQSQGLVSCSTCLNINEVNNREKEVLNLVECLVSKSRRLADLLVTGTFASK